MEIKVSGTRVTVQDEFFTFTTQRRLVYHEINDEEAVRDLAYVFADLLRQAMSKHYGD